MTNWIPATRETAGYYADDPALGRPYPPTCRERQDAAIEDLQVAAGYVQAATERLTRELAELRARVDALDDDDEPRTATPNQTYSWLPGDAWSQYCAEVEAQFVPPPMHGRCGPGETTITWDQQIVRVPKLGYLEAEKRIPQPPRMVAMMPLPNGEMLYEERTTEPPPLYTPGYEAEG